jgi:hypothetical protein
MGCGEKDGKRGASHYRFPLIQKEEVRAVGKKE